MVVLRYTQDDHNKYRQLNETKVMMSITVINFYKLVFTVLRR